MKDAAKKLREETKDLEISNFYLKKILKERYMKDGLSEEESEQIIENAIQKAKIDIMNL